MDISSGIPAFDTDAERAAYHAAITDMMAHLATLDDQAKRAHVLSAIKTALSLLGTAVGVASGVGLIPAAVLPFVGVVTSAADGLVKAIESVAP